MRVAFVASVLVVTTSAQAQTHRTLDFWRAKYRGIEAALTRKDAKSLRVRLASNYTYNEPNPEWDQAYWPSPEPPVDAKVLWNSLKTRSVHVNGSTAKVQFVWGYRYNYTPKIPPSEFEWEAPEDLWITVHLTGTDFWKLSKGKWVLSQTHYDERKRTVSSERTRAVLETGVNYLAPPTRLSKTATILCEAATYLPWPGPIEIRSVGQDRISARESGKSPVTFSISASGKIQTQAAAAKRTPDERSPMAARAFRLAVKKLDGAQHLHLPVNVQLIDSRKGFTFSFDRLPPTPGAVTFVKVSADLKSVTVTGGQ